MIFHLEKEDENKRLVLRYIPKSMGLDLFDCKQVL